MAYRRITDFVKNLFNAQEDIPVAKKLPDGIQAVAIEWPTQPVELLSEELGQLQNIPPTILEALEIEDKYECSIGAEEINRWSLLRARADKEGLRGGIRQELSDWTL